MEHWGEVEADFLREYGINLVQELPHMSFRRFKVLVNGLSTESIFVLTRRSEADGSKPIEDPDQAEKALKANGFW